MKRVLSIMACVAFVVVSLVVFSPSASAVQYDAPYIVNGEFMAYVPPVPTNSARPYSNIMVLYGATKSDGTAIDTYYLVQTENIGDFYFELNPNANQDTSNVAGIIRRYSETAGLYSTYQFQVQRGSTQTNTWGYSYGAVSGSIIGYLPVNKSLINHYSSFYLLYTNFVVTAPYQVGTGIQWWEPDVDNLLDFGDLKVGSLYTSFHNDSNAIGSYVNVYFTANPMELVTHVDGTIKKAGVETVDFSYTYGEVVNDDLFEMSFALDVVGEWTVTVNVYSGDLKITREVSFEVLEYLPTQPTDPPTTPPTDPPTTPATKDPLQDWLENGHERDPAFDDGLAGVESGITDLEGQQDKLFDDADSAIGAIASDFNFDFSQYTASFAFVGGIFNDIVGQFSISGLLQVLTFPLILAIAMMIIGMASAPSMQASNMNRRDKHRAGRSGKTKDGSAK